MSANAAPIAIVIHAGAGGQARDKFPPEKEKQYHAALAKALRAGHAVLKKGGPAIEAVEAAIVVMEDTTLFNAGKGAVFTSAGENELDASIMDGDPQLNKGRMLSISSAVFYRTCDIGRPIILMVRPGIKLPSGHITTVRTI